MLVALVVVGQALGALRGADNAWYSAAFQAFAAESNGDGEKMHKLLQMWADHERDPTTLGLVQDAMEKKTTGFLQSSKSADVDLPFPNAEKEAAQLDAAQAPSQLSLSTTATTEESAAAAPWTPPKMNEDAAASAPWTPPKMADSTPSYSTPSYSTPSYSEPTAAAPTMSLSTAKTTEEVADDSVAPWTPPGQKAPEAPKVKSSITPYTAPGGKKDDNAELAAIQQENPEAYGIVKALLLKQQMGLPLPGSKHNGNGNGNQQASMMESEATASTSSAGSEEYSAPAPRSSAHITDMFNWKPPDSAADDAAVASVLSTVQSGSSSSQTASSTEADDTSNPFDSIPKVATPAAEPTEETPASAPASSPPASTGKNALDAFLR